VLSGLHAARGERYGWHEDHAFGAVDIANTWADDWSTFWAERRLLANRRHIGASLARRIEALARDIGNRLPAEPVASLLHGDLWGGNVLVADRRISGLIDPACYYGHAEVDLAMLSLFDHPSAEFFASYRPLEAGHEARLPIYQLWPALVHLRLFGRGYAPLVERLLAAAGV
jgi:fructosamine-3-kinase